MKSCNYYLEAIAVALGMEKPANSKNNNWYLKKIYELSDGISDESIKEDLLK